MCLNAPQNFQLHCHPKEVGGLKLWIKLYAFLFLRTLLTQEAVILIQGLPLTDHLEGMVSGTCSSKAAVVSSRSMILSWHLFSY